MSPNEIKTLQTRRQTERAVLGALLAAPFLVDLPEVRLLRTADFGAEGHRAIWRAIRARCDEALPITPAAIRAEMERAASGELADLAGIATEPDLNTALVALLREAKPDRLRFDATALRHMGENLQLADRLAEISNEAQLWPPTPRSTFCEALDALASRFCSPLAEVS